MKTKFIVEHHSFNNDDIHMIYRKISDNRILIIQNTEKEAPKQSQSEAVQELTSCNVAIISTFLLAGSLVMLA